MPSLLSWTKELCEAVVLFIVFLKIKKSNVQDLRLLREWMVLQWHVCFHYSIEREYNYAYYSLSTEEIKTEINDDERKV